MADVSFLEFIGPVKALAYGLAAGFLIGMAFTIWAAHVDG